MYRRRPVASRWSRHRGATTGRRRSAPDHESDQPVRTDGTADDRPPTAGRPARRRPGRHDRRRTGDRWAAARTRTGGRRGSGGRPAPSRPEAGDRHRRRTPRRDVRNGPVRGQGRADADRRCPHARRTTSRTAPRPARPGPHRARGLRRAPARGPHRRDPDPADRRPRGPDRSGRTTGTRRTTTPRPATTPARPKAPPAVRIGRCAAASVALLLVLVAGMGWVGRTWLDGALHAGRRRRRRARRRPRRRRPDRRRERPARRHRQRRLRGRDRPGEHRRRRAHATPGATMTVRHAPAGPGDHPAALRALGRRRRHLPGADRSRRGPHQLDSAYAVGGPRCATRAVQQVTGLAITRLRRGRPRRDLGAAGRGGRRACRCASSGPVLDSALGPIVPTAGHGPLDGARRRAPSCGPPTCDDEPAGAAALVAPATGARCGARAGALAHRAAGPRPGQRPAARPRHRAGVDGHRRRPTSSRCRPALGDGPHRRPPSRQPNSRGNRVLRAAEAQALFARRAHRRPAPGTGPGAGHRGTAPTDVTARGASTPPAATALAGEVAGHAAASSGSASADVAQRRRSPRSQTVIRYSPDQAPTRRSCSPARCPSATAVPDPGTTGVLQLVLGRSFDGVVQRRRRPRRRISRATPAAPAVTCG